VGEEDVSDRGTKVVVAAGSEDVVLTIDPGPSLLVRVDGFPSTGFSWAQATLHSVEPRTVTRSMNLSPDGSARFLGLRGDATYTLFVGPVEGRSALRRGVRAGGEVRVSLTPGKSITGRLRLPEGTEHSNINARFEQFAHVQGTIDRDGRYEIVGLTDGTWTVFAWAQTKDKSWASQGDAVAGGSLDLELKPR